MWVVDSMEARPTVSPLPRFDCTDDPKTGSSMPPEHTVVECEDVSGSRGTLSITHTFYTMLFRRLFVLGLITTPLVFQKLRVG